MLVYKYTKLQELVLYYHCEEISTFRRALSKSWWTSPVLMTVFSRYSELIRCFWLKFIFSYFLHKQCDRDVISDVFVGVRYTCQGRMQYHLHLKKSFWKLPESMNVPDLCLCFIFLTRWCDKDSWVFNITLRSCYFTQVLPKVLPCELK